jgi:L-seryl-tRNA(Ser) seleniumtransferase
MLGAAPEELRARATALAAATGGEVVATTGRVGGGALPLAELASYAVALEDPRGAEALAAALRAGAPPVACLIRDGRVLLDALALDERDLEELPALLERARR